METKKILVFDTETTGKADFNLQPDHESQPRLVELAAVMVEVPSFRQIAALCRIIKPEGFEIPEEAAKIHGVTTGFATQYGFGRDMIMNAFYRIVDEADEVWAFNAEYDSLVIKGEMVRMSRPLALDCDTFKCAMKPLTKVCKIPGPYGLKWPKLSEAYRHFYGRDFDGAHNALGDVLATIAVLKAWNPWQQEPPIQEA